MLLAYVGDSDPFDPPTKLIVLDDATSTPAWGLQNLDDVVVDVCTFRSGTMDRPAFVCVSEEGKVWFHQKESVIEDIPDAGLYKPTSRKLGYLGGIRQLGSELYAFGYAGQIYRRSAPGRWEPVDRGIIGVPGDHYDVADLCLSGNTLYAVTKLGDRGRIYSRSGDRWIPEDNPSGAWLNAIAADQDGTLWICGRNGTLLKGNAATGFSRVGAAGCTEEFLSVALFGGTLWLSSATSLYTWSSDRLCRVDTGISPDLRSANRLQVADGVLWSFGYDDVLRYDGERWTRLICPGTEPFPAKGSQ
ncbi:hypothetical protein [Xanthomonas sp. 3075]|uniref:hypothetical protein n=1 Tax=Xanthomonas sp. 3075 TaxID=3035315 RepID=UPI00161245DD|nr:hypothetical protein [Xanthomonas sp. 3075]MBB4130829.1 hypothetical protein [Xanthomonas sp. 3075]